MTDLRVGDEPRWITEAILLAIHAQQIERYVGAYGVRDKGVVLEGPDARANVLSGNERMPHTSAL